MLTSREINNRLHDALDAAAIPVVGVAIPDPANKATWRIDYARIATDQQKAAGAAFLATFNPDDGVHAQREADRATDEALMGVSDDVIFAILEKLPEMIAEAQAGTLKGNLGQWRSRIRARVKSLRRPT